MVCEPIGAEGIACLACVGTHLEYAKTRGGGEARSQRVVKVK